MEMLMIMYEQQTDRLEGTAADLARMCRCTPEEIAHAMEELKFTGTASVFEEQLCVQKSAQNARRNVTRYALVARRVTRYMDERKRNADRQKRFRSKTRNGKVTARVTAMSRPAASASASADNSKELSPPQPPHGGVSGSRVGGQDLWPDAAPGVGAEEPGIPPPPAGRAAARRRSAAAKFDPLSADLPQVLQTDAFRAAWSEWVQYRRESRKPLTASTATKQLKQLEKFGHDSAIASITASITAGWQGIFDQGDGRGPATSAARRDGKVRGVPAADPFRDAPARRVCRIIDVTAPGGIVTETT